MINSCTFSSTPISSSQCKAVGNFSKHFLCGSSSVVGLSLDSAVEARAVAATVVETAEELTAAVVVVWTTAGAKVSNAAGATTSATTGAATSTTTRAATSATNTN